MVAYFVVGFLLAVTLLRTVSGPRQPSEDIHHAEGSELNLKNQAGDTPLDAAIKQWSVQVEVWEQGEWNGTAKSWERSIQEWEQCIELLRRHGAKTNSTTWPQQRPHP
jgi:hypothetical protein